MNTESVTKHITNWIKDYAENAGIKSLIIGVSGGIDSAITSTLCAKTGLKVYCLELGIHQKENQVDRAKNHIDWLKGQYNNVEGIQLDLTTAFDSLVNLFPTIDNKELENMSSANARARIRMTTLYYYAQIYSGIVVGTGNKIEDFGVGFYTKYGDGGVDISPIADLFKSEVFKIGKHLNILESIQNAAPTDGLWEDDRTDEDQMGASYDELEWAMVNTNNDNSSFTERQKQVIKIYNRLHNANKHKMIPIPICKIDNQIKK